ncbi:MAG TPA: DNA-3-methyladenine glycosylase [Polyangiaceae bacterium]|nr:DNA-3-methyladenine glycosylase [Polyangiaceae bacterium]
MHRKAAADLSLDRLRAARLPRTWYASDAVVRARSLIGCLLVREGPAGSVPRVSRIVETEAYRGARDLACHARAGLTKRTRALLGQEGHAYVFFIYGMHDCFNVTCAGEGRGHAVLVRAGEPVSGFVEPGVRLDGPGRFARAMGITRAFDGHDLTEPPLYLCPRRTRPRIAVTARVGVGYAGPWADRPWRFLDAGSAHVSKPPKSAIGRPG